MAACSDVSPSLTAPFGSPHRERLRVAIIATNATPSRNEITAPPDECSFRVFRFPPVIRSFYCGGPSVRMSSKHRTKRLVDPFGSVDVCMESE